MFFKVEVSSSRGLVAYYVFDTYRSAIRFVGECRGRGWVAVIDWV